MFNRILYIGISETLEKTEQKRIKLINLFGVLAMVFNLVAILIFFEQKELLYVFIVDIVIYASTLVLNDLRLFFWSKNLLVNYLSVAITLISYIAGRDSLAQVMFFVPMCLSAILFGEKERLWRYIGYCIPFCCFFFLEGTGYDLIEAEPMHGFALMMAPFISITFTASSIFWALHYFTEATDKAEKSMGDLLNKTQTQNSELQAITEELNQNQEELFATNKQLASYQKNLEKRVKERTKQLRIEKAKANHAKSGLEVIHRNSLQHQKELESTLEELKSTNENLADAKSELETAFEKEHEIRGKLEYTLKELQSTQSKLIHSEKMASLGQLTAGVAHEINNPINFVSAGANILEDNLKDILEVLAAYQEIDFTADLETIQRLRKNIVNLEKEIEIEYAKNEIVQTVEDIKEGAKRTSQIVVGLRNFSRLDEDKLKMADLHECIDSTLVILGNQFKDKVSIEKKYDLTISQVSCYPSQLNQVFMNLISNAIDAIEEDGRILISTQNSEEEVEITIQDNGSGIPEEVQDRIFDPFFTTKDVGKGTGLGLSISYGIIQKHKGQIQAVSESGKGTTFVIKLPKKPVV